LGLLEGYVTTTVAPLDPESAKTFENLHNNIPFNAGKALGDAIAGVQAVLGIVEGAFMIVGGGGEVLAGLATDSALEDALGVATVVAGVGMIGQGFGAFGRASTNLGNDLQKLFNPIDIGGGASPTKAKKVKTNDLPEPPKGHECYERKDGKIESRAKAPEGYEWYKSKSGNNHVRRKPGNQKLAELEYNFKTHTFEVKDETPDFEAKQIGEDIEIDVSGSNLFDEQLTIRREAMVKRDELIERKNELKEKNKELSEEDELKLKDAHQRVQDSSEAMGEIGIRHFMETQYPHYERIEVANSSGASKQGRFDSIYKDPGPPPEYIVVEGKGGDGIH
jgi:hypothetical protein